MYWRRWSSKPDFRKKSFWLGSHVSCLEPLINTRRMVVYPPREGSATLFVKRRTGMGIVWTIIIGFIAGVIAKFLMPGNNEPSGFILTTILGIVGAIVASYLGQALGWYGPGEGAGLIGAVVGAIIVLFVYGLIAGRS